jgi:hypothetical protein
VDVFYFKSTSYEHLTRGQRTRLQMNLLDCPWCTYALIKKHIDVVTYLAITKEWRLRGQMQPTKPSTDRSPLPAINDSKNLDDFLYRGDCRTTQTDILCTTIQQRRLEAPGKVVTKAQVAMVFHYAPHQALNPKFWNNEAVEYLFFIHQRLPLYPAFKDIALFRGMETAVKYQNS